MPIERREPRLVITEEFANQVRDQFCLLDPYKRLHDLIIYAGGGLSVKTVLDDQLYAWWTFTNSLDPLQRMMLNKMLATVCRTIECPTGLPFITIGEIRSIRLDEIPPIRGLGKMGEDFLVHIGLFQDK